MPFAPVLNAQSNCLGAFSAAQQVLPSMVERSSGTILLTGATASLRGGANFSGLVSAALCVKAKPLQELRCKLVPSLSGCRQIWTSCSCAVPRPRIWSQGDPCGAHHHRWPSGSGTPYEGEQVIHMQPLTPSCLDDEVTHCWGFVSFYYSFKRHTTGLSRTYT